MLNNSDIFNDQIIFNQTIFYMKNLYLLLLVCSLGVAAQAQDGGRWSPVNEAAVGKNLFANRYKPQAYKIFQLNEGVFSMDLTTVPNEARVRTSESAFVLAMPNSDGQIEHFRLVESPVMDPALAARYPNIKSYKGVGIEDPSAFIRCDYSPRGFHAMVMSANRKTQYIDPVDRDGQYYVVFSRKDVVDYQSDFHCLTAASASSQTIQAPLPSGARGADDGKLRTYRLALACTGEYANYFLNGTETTDAQRKAKVLAAMNTLMTRTNGIYERDFGIHMNLIANNDAIIYLNASTDPWTTEWNTKTQQTIDAVIGTANYDIGHLVHKEASAANNNGNAGCIGCVCKAGMKGSAFTSHVAPEGDPFVVDYTTHEMGHQFGANHTFTFSNESGTASQFEPGSGSTIMGYAGITGATDVQPHSDDYFHARSIEQVTDYIKLATGGAACAVVTTTGDATPTANAGLDYTIPKSTPFALTATATDADAADVLTYTWEQYNAGTSTTTNPSATATSGPVFRSRPYSTNPTRTFPILASILDGTNGNQWERLPSVARTLTFRLTVRDNHAGGGQTRDDNANVTISSASGPFAVTAPNTAVTWAGGSTQTITWSVASSNLAPVNCANVKISLSTDGGQTFSTVLAASTPNDGTEALVIPTTPSTTARIKIEAVGNIFFDISNTNFTIGGAVTCGNATGLNTTAITNTSATVNWTAVANAISYAVDYKLTTATTWTSVTASTTATNAAISGLTQGTVYDWRVRATCASGSGNYVAAQFTTTAPAVCNAPAGLASASITTTGATVSWGAVTSASNYDVDYKLSTATTWTNWVTSTTATSAAISGLTASTLYDWRVRTNCSFGTSGYTAAQFTTAAVQSGCVTAYEANETQATAATIATGAAISAAISTATDIDYYKFTTTGTNNLAISLTNLPADFDLVLYNSAGTQIGSSANGSTTSESIAYANAAAGTYYIKVFGYNGALSTTVCYNLTATATPVITTGCASTYDNTTNGTTAGAAQIPLNTNITGTIGTSTDVDYYKFVVTTGGTLTISLTTLPADYDVKLYSSNGTTQLAVSQKSGTASESIAYTAAAGTYYIRVYGYSSAFNATSCYTLKVTTGTAAKNDLFVNANQPAVSVFPNPVQSVLNISLNNTQGVSDIRVFDVTGVQVLAARTSQSRTTLNMEKLTRGLYLVKVFHGDREVSSIKVLKQ